MSKAVLISIKPKYCTLITNRVKTIEVRKTKPKIETPFKCYIYCTKEEEPFYYKPKDIGNELRRFIKGNGKVIGEFVCDRISKIECDSNSHIKYSHDSCLTQDDFIEYCNGRELFGWHISDLVIYGIPKELKEFRSFSEKTTRIFDRMSGRWIYEKTGNTPVFNAPQSWCYVNEL